MSANKKRRTQAPITCYFTQQGTTSQAHTQTTENTITNDSMTEHTANSMTAHTANDMTAYTATSMTEDTNADTTVIRQPTDITTDELLSNESDVVAMNEQKTTTSMYVEEMNIMLNTVLKEEQFLFNKEELALFSTYTELTDPAKYLLVKLLMRKRRWIRESKLNYETINIKDTIEELSSTGLVDTDPDDQFDLISMLSLPEIKDLTRDIKIRNKMTLKVEYEQFLMQAMKPSLKNRIQQIVGQCIRVNSLFHNLYHRLQIVYYRVHHLNTFNPSTAILSRITRYNYPIYEYHRSNTIWLSRRELIEYEEALLQEKEFEDSHDWTLCENKLGVWEECTRQDVEKPYYMRRYEAGAIYTRLIDHGRDILGKQHEYALESIILSKLLDQTRYRLGKRGRWYDRLALIQMTYLCKNMNKQAARTMKKNALETCIRAIHDRHVHQTHLSSIHKRIHRLERDLCIPLREQHDFSYLQLKEPVNRVIYGERLSDEIVGKKSVWRSDNGAECSVEQVAIEYYTKQGYKGLHAENGVVRMLAVLLFWDIIFAPIPGVFETPYQVAPLDLSSDVFYEERLSLIQNRLHEIEQGDYLQMIQAVYEREYERQTMAVGMNWNYELKDMMEIAECLGPSCLSSLCNLMFQEFGRRQGGMPDLCCWNYNEKKCLFSEVKGPGDTLSETQKLWIETLSGFGILVEVCYVKVWRGDDILLNS